MFRRLIVIFAVFAISASQLDAQPAAVEEPAATDKPDERQKEVVAEPFYPLVQGAQWHYVMKLEDSDHEMTNKVAKLEKIDDQQLYRIETLLDGQVVATEHLSHTEKGLYRNRFNGAVLSPPLLLLRNPIKRGDKWENRTQIGASDLNITCKVDADKTETPAGKFDTLKLTVTTNVEDTDIVSHYWFAANVGIVKQIMDIGGKKVAIELQKYEPANTEPAAGAGATAAK